MSGGSVVGGIGSVVLVLAVSAGVMAIVVAAYRRREEERNQVAAWAARWGWTVLGDDPSLAVRWQGEPFGEGHGRAVSDVLTGRWADRPVLSFTYSCRVGAGRGETTLRYHVLVMTLPVPLPTLQLTPDGLGTRMAAAFGGQDIEFESADFNREWRVQCADLKFAHDVVHPRLMERLLAADAWGSSLRISGTDLLSWEPEVSWGPESAFLDRIAPRLALMSSLVDAVPRHVWQEHGYDPGPGPVPQPGVQGPAAR